MGLRPVDLARRAGISNRGFRRYAAPNTVRSAVQAISDACIPDPDAVLRQLLSDVITECTALCSAPVPGAAARAGERPQPGLTAR